MPKDRNTDDLPADDLEALKTARTDWDGVADDEAPEEDEDEILEDVLGTELAEEDDVIAEDDDNPYQESDEALPEDDEERDIAQHLRRE